MKIVFKILPPPPRTVQGTEYSTVVSTRIVHVDVLSSVKCLAATRTVRKPTNHIVPAGQSVVLPPVHEGASPPP
jgi:hypothetical protein